MIYWMHTQYEQEQ